MLPLYINYYWKCMFCPGCGYWVWDVLYLLLLLVIKLEANNDEKFMFWIFECDNQYYFLVWWWFRPEVQKLCQGSTEGLRAAKYDKVASTFTKWFANPDVWSRPGVKEIEELTNRTQNASSWLWTTPSWGWGLFCWNTKTRQGTTSHRCVMWTKMSKICFFLCYTCMYDSDPWYCKSIWKGSHQAEDGEQNEGELSLNL